MTPEAAEQAAEILLQCRDEGSKIDQLPESCRPSTRTEGYQVQDAVLRVDGTFQVGWKVAATNHTTQSMLGINQPFAGRLPSAALAVSPLDVQQGRFANPALEGEFAVMLGAGLKGGDEPYDSGSVADAVAAVIPAVEIVDSRIGDRKAAGENTLIAAGTVAGLVLGTPSTDWRQYDLRSHRVALSIDGSLKGEGDGAEVLGDPLNSLAWLANLCIDLGCPLAAGQIVTLGTCTGLAPIEAGSEGIADFGPLGEVRVNF
ncbi:MAG: hydratase [Rhodospirillaceae bacterium]|nr:hydratase [Rhodospirillaceae bacterium]|tara:strand:+ start:2982 stop:3758 length:777 start_codon:yes stop_codon:yes gene_type:complete